VTNKIFEVTGARATASKYGFDLYWRNVRTHTLHDPVLYEAREIGEYFLSQRPPEFTFYSCAGAGEDSPYESPVTVKPTLGGCRLQLDDRAPQTSETRTLHAAERAFRLLRRLRVFHAQLLDEIIKLRSQVNILLHAWRQRFSACGANLGERKAHGFQGG
jgi:hypothetical protein